MELNIIVFLQKSINTVLLIQFCQEISIDSIAVPLDDFDFITTIDNK